MYGFGLAENRDLFIFQISLALATSVSLPLTRSPSLSLPLTLSASLSLPLPPRLLSPSINLSLPWLSPRHPSPGSRLPPQALLPYPHEPPTTKPHHTAQICHRFRKEHPMKRKERHRAIGGGGGRISEKNGRGGRGGHGGRGGECRGCGGGGGEATEAAVMAEAEADAAIEVAEANPEAFFSRFLLFLF
ncbi:hypothetical protein LR48_Vigan11g138300 [Vigna angularis]|uniref:Uncharacterized protein n=1 Tax=Phaseolus angularis TaxID=3914 RepID=A0A0L9VUA1_PHAAN|nr:hypothetical protein LR48_Vigan11g138300 [Vigna angularis]